MNGEEGDPIHNQMGGIPQFKNLAKMPVILATETNNQPLYGFGERTREGRQRKEIENRKLRENNWISTPLRDNENERTIENNIATPVPYHERHVSFQRDPRDGGMTLEGGDDEIGENTEPEITVNPDNIREIDENEQYTNIFRPRKKFVINF